MSRLIIKNPENITTFNPYMTFVIKHINEILRWKYGRQPNAMTGYVRGSQFFTGAMKNKSNLTLTWNNTRIAFSNYEGVQGLQLYSTLTGGNIGLISFFDTSKSNNVEKLGDKSDSILVTFTSHYRMRDKICNAVIGKNNFDMYTEFVSIHYNLAKSSKQKSAYQQRIKGKVNNLLQRVIDDNTLDSNTAYSGVLNWRNPDDGTANTTLSRYLRDAQNEVSVTCEDELEGLMQELKKDKYNHIFKMPTRLSYIPLVLELFFNEEIKKDLVVNADIAPVLEKLKKLYTKAITFTNFASSCTKVVIHEHSTDTVIYFDSLGVGVYPMAQSFNYSFFKNINELIEKYPELDSTISVLNVGLSKSINAASETTRVETMCSDYISGIGLGIHHGTTSYAYWNGRTEGTSYYYFDPINDNTSET